MANSSWQANVSAGLARRMRQRRWSRRRTLAVTGLALLLLYTGLISATQGRAVAAPPREAAALPALPQNAPTATPQPTPAQADDSSVSPTLLAELERLQGSGGAIDRQEFGAIRAEQNNLAGTLLFSLLLIAGAVYGGVWLYKRYGGNGSGVQVGGRLLAVQESHAIGPNQKLHLVRMGDELLLIGATEQNISFLARFDGDPAEASFAEHLHSAVGPESRSGLDLNEGLQRLRGLTRPDKRGGGND